mmetsp:Transcript_50448/g.162349  ORF Transcript_50448/g.162349 Transcript_50448/m.162349 type:complete len:217 (-) Transcript_50448:627-1277(-)
MVQSMWCATCVDPILWWSQSKTRPYGRSTVRKAPRMYENSSLVRWGTSTSVCCSHVYSTSHAFVKRYGAPYSIASRAPPIFEATRPRTPSMAPMPRSERQTLSGQEAGHRLVLNGLTGTKWFDVPYFGPPVAPHSRYAGQPKTRWNTSCSVPHARLPSFSAFSRSCSPPPFSMPSRPWTTKGTCVSPLVMWFVCAWWTACERCQLKYGTSSSVWRK